MRRPTPRTDKSSSRPAENTPRSDPKREIRIQFDNSLMDVVIDRFGENVECAKAGTDNAFVIRCEVQISPPFWGWLFQFGTKAKILEPFDVVREARLRLSEMVDKY